MVEYILMNYGVHPKVVFHIGTTNDDAVRDACLLFMEYDDWYFSYGIYRHIIEFDEKIMSEVLKIFRWLRPNQKLSLDVKGYDLIWHPKVIGLVFRNIDIFTASSYPIDKTVIADAIHYHGLLPFREWDGDVDRMIGDMFAFLEERRGPGMEISARLSDVTIIAES